jgi:gas vesicle protein
MSERSSGLSFIVGALVGAAVGAVVGILFAPDSGVETRKKIATKSKEFADEMHKKFDDLKETVVDAMEEVKTTASKKVDDLKKAASKSA